MLLTSEHVHNKSKFKGIKRHRPNFHSSPSALQVSSSDDTTLTNFFCNLLEMSSAHKAYIGSSFSPFTYGAFVFKKNTYLAGPDLSCGSISAICCSTWDLLVAACGMSFPDWRLNAGSLHWECGVSAPGPPGKSLHTLHSIHSVVFLACYNSFQKLTPYWHILGCLWLLKVSVSSSANQLTPRRMSYFHVGHGEEILKGSKTCF